MNQTSIGQLSEDGFWFWSGAQWLSTISPDGLWKWDGKAWLPMNQSQASFGASALLRHPPSQRYRRLVLGSLLVGVVIAPIVAGVSLESAATTGSADWQYLAILSGIVFVAVLTTLGLLARPAVWDRVPPQSRDWRLSMATATLGFGVYAVVVWLLLILGGVLTIPDFLIGPGRGSGRDAVVGVVLVAGPTLTLALVAATPYWRSLMAAPIRVRSDSLWLLGIAWLCGLPILAVLSAAQGAGQLAVVLIGLLVPPLVGFVGLLLKREWGRVATTLACLCWAATGFGLLFSVPLFLLLWLKVRMPTSPVHDRV